MAFRGFLFDLIVDFPLRECKVTTAESNHQPKPFRRVFKIVFILMVLSISLVAWFYHSNWIAREVIALLVSRINGFGQVNLEISNFSGNLASGFKLEKLHLKQRNPSLQLLAGDINLQIDWQRLQKGVVAIIGAVKQVEVSGMISSGFNSAQIPDYHGMACFAGLPANFQISSFSVNVLKIQPWPDMPLIFAVNQFAISPTADFREQNIAMFFAADWRSKKIGGGGFIGRIQSGQKKIEGKLDFGFAGQRISSELNLAEKKGWLEASGFIASSSLDLANLSHWLVPLWQDSFPFGFDGQIDCAGSWLFSHELGFMGNLSGKCRNLRMVALGLFITVLELNGNWKLFDGGFGFSDSGSSFFGFPASLTGRIDSVLEPTRKWELNFDCNQIDFARLANDLPWGVKYGMNLPALKGGATLTVQLRNGRPEINAKLATSDLQAGNGLDARSITGNIDYLLGSKGSGQLKIAMDCLSRNLPPPFIQRFKGRRGNLFSKLSGGTGPFVFTYSLTGSPPGGLNLDGLFMAGDQCVGRTSGRWHEGMGDVIFTSVDSNASLSDRFVASQIPLLELILAK